VPPSLLELAWRCRKWNSLPFSGGILDQPYLMLLVMEHVEEEYEEDRAERAAVQTAISPENIKKLAAKLPGERRD
jgi:hypothetical protein